jgi:hypothetical protein
MAYLTRVGPNSENLSRLESRGYHVYRRGTRVRVVWGPIEFQRSQLVSVVWTRATMFKDYKRRTPAAAAELVRQIVENRINAGYSKLPKGSRISPPAYATGITRRR